MNFLAHILLADHTDAAMVGALLGDFAKAGVAGRFTPEIEYEIVLHRKIDRFTDTHDIVLGAIKLFREPCRRYAGIMLDVLYDHFLALRWSDYCDVPRALFIARFYRALLAHEAILPDRLREIAPLMIEHDWLGSYVEYDSVEFAISRISRRLSRNGHLMREGLADMRTHYDALAMGFDAFFPKLVAYVDAQRDEQAGRGVLVVT